MTPCPPTDAVTRAAADPDAADPALLAHVAECDRCRERFDATDGPVRFGLLAETEATPPDETPTHRFLDRLKAVVRLAGDPAWPALPGLEIQEEIARGGMGVVYKAHDPKLGRTVAVKMLPPEYAPDPDALARLLREAKALAALSHPNVVSLLFAGEVGGRPYLVLEYVPGGSLRQLLRAGPWAEADAVRLLRAIADATAAAHALGIIHRDLKPGNILMNKAEGGRGKAEPESLSAFPLPPSALLPKVADFGLARFLDAADKQTVTGEVLGTPEYMAPEQALGRADLVGPETDVWALGGLLYEVLTGRPPFAASTRTAIVRQVTSAEPVSPDKLRVGLSPDIAAICLKCLEKEQKRRYRSAADLREDLDRFLAGRSVSARPRSWLGRVRDRVRRHPLRSLAAGAALMLPLGVVAGAAWAWRDADLLRARYEAAAADLYVTRVRLAAEAIIDGKMADARELLAMGQPVAGEPDPRGWEWAYLANRLRGPAETVLKEDQAVGLHFPPPAPSPAAAVSPDGRRRAVIDAAGGLEVRDEAGRLLLRLDAPGGKKLTGAQFSHDGRWLAARTTADELVVFDGAPGGLAGE
jgi:hypothetical protein